MNFFTLGEYNYLDCLLDSREVLHSISKTCTIGGRERNLQFRKPLRHDSTS